MVDFVAAVRALRLLPSRRFREGPGRWSGYDIDPAGFVIHSATPAAGDDA